jgi:hypothetical protein
LTVSPIDPGRGATAALPLCAPGAWIAAWHRAQRPAPSRWPLHGGEPVIYSGGRQIIREALRTRRVDSILPGVAALTALPGRVVGAKSAAVCRWIFDLLGAEPGNSPDGLFRGSSAVSRAWAACTGRANPSHPARANAS